MILGIKKLQDDFSCNFLFALDLLVDSPGIKKLQDDFSCNFIIDKEGVYYFTISLRVTLSFPMLKFTK